MEDPQVVTVNDSETNKERSFFIIQPPEYNVEQIFNLKARYIENDQQVSEQYERVQDQIDQFCQNMDSYEPIEVFDKINLPTPPVDVKQGWGAPTTSKFEREYLISINDFTDNGQEIKNRLKVVSNDSIKKPVSKQESSTIFARNTSKRVKNTQVDEFDDLNW